MSCEKREESSSLKTHDDPLTCFQEENASVAERNSMKRIPGRSSRDFLATRKERSKGKKGGKKRKGEEREREEGNKTSKKQREKRFEALLETSREAGREGKRGKKGQEAAKAEQERRLKASAG